MYTKFFTAILFTAATMAQAQSTAIKFEAFCYEGKVSARQINAGNGPTKPLTLLVAGVRPITCKDGDLITIGSIGEVKETPEEGLSFFASVLIEPKSGEAKSIIFSTFQQKPFPRNSKATMI